MHATEDLAKLIKAVKDELAAEICLKEVDEAMKLFDSCINSLREASSTVLSGPVTESLILKLTEAIQKSRAPYCVENSKFVALFKDTEDKMADCVEIARNMVSTLLSMVPQISKKVNKQEEGLLMHYPASASPRDSVPILCTDLKCLEPGMMIKNAIMSSYTLHLAGVLPLENIGTSKIANQYLITDPSFFSRLKEGGPEKVKHWFLSQSLASIRYLFIIVPESEHWSLAVVKKLEGGETGHTNIYHLDSSEGSHNSQQIFEVIKQYLEDKLNIKNDIATKQLTVPQQAEDSKDGGIYTLYNIQRIIQDAGAILDETTFKEIDKDWYEPEAAAALRGKIKDVMRKNKMEITQQGNCGSCVAAEEHACSTLKEWSDAFI